MWEKPGQNQSKKDTETIEISELFVDRSSEKNGETQVKLRANYLLDKFIQAITKRSSVE